MYRGTEKAAMASEGRGPNREMFAALLVRIYQAVKPRFTILDGVSARGEGPGKGGRPKELGIFLGSTDAVGLEASSCATCSVWMKRRC